MVEASERGRKAPETFYEEIGLEAYMPVLALCLTVGYSDCTGRHGLDRVVGPNLVLLIGSAGVYQGTPILWPSPLGPGAQRCPCRMFVHKWEEGTRDGVVVNGLFHYDGVFYHGVDIRVVTAAQLTGYFFPERAVLDAATPLGALKHPRGKEIM